MATVENETYGVKWLKCEVCGLIAPDVVKDKDGNPNCPSIERCRAVILNQPLGRTVWPIKKEDEP